MSESRKLNADQLQDALAKLPQWQLGDDGSAIAREYRFGDFMQAFAFMTEMAIWSEKQDHHPEWFNVYSRVKVTLTTHDAAGLTEKDLAWARRADATFARDHSG